MTRDDANGATLEPWFWRLVEAGDTRAMVCVGDSFATRDARKAAEWYRRAADLGDAEAMVRLAEVPARPADARRAGWYAKAAEAGHPGAMWTLANRTVDPDEILRWTRAAAERGHGGAAGRLGTYLQEHGKLAEAVTWYRRAIEAGDTWSTIYVNLARVLADLGRLDEAQACLETPASRGLPEAVDLLLEVIERRGEQPGEWRTRLPPRTVWSIACRARSRGEDEEQWLRSAAERGHAAAAARLGEITLERGRPEEAERWCQQAAEAGDEKAATDLGRALILLDRAEEAVPWLRKSAEIGGDEALNLLVEVFDRAGDHAQAEAWRARAMEVRTRSQAPTGDWAMGPVGGHSGVAVLVATAVVAAAVAPFVKTLVAKAAEDTYIAVRGWLGRLFASHSSDRGRSRWNNHLLVVEDPDPQLKLALHLWTDTPSEAIRALEDLDLDMIANAARRKRKLEKVRIYWDQGRRSWRTFDE